MELHELQPIDGADHVVCGGCGGVVDPFGRHYGICKNRGGLWGYRHDTVEAATVRQMRLTRGCNAFPTRGRGNIFAAPALRPGGWKRADIVAYNYYGTGKHLFLDDAAGVVHRARL